MIWSEESVVMALWLESITVKLAHESPEDVHASLLNCRTKIYAERTEIQELCALMSF